MAARDVQKETGMGLESGERVELREFLLNHFNMEDMEDLIFELGVDYEDLPHGTHRELARELILYCERTGFTGCLLQKVVEKRPDEKVMALMARVEPCHSARERVQVILRLGSLKVTREEFLSRLASCFEHVSPGDITLIGVAEYGARALVGVPAEPAPAPGAVTKDAVKRFEDLDALDQQTWHAGFKQGVWNPRVQISTYVSPEPVSAPEGPADVASAQPDDTVLVPPLGHVRVGSVGIPKRLLAVLGTLVATSLCVLAVVLTAPLDVHAIPGVVEAPFYVSFWPGILLIVAIGLGLLLFLLLWRSRRISSRKPRKLFAPTDWVQPVHFLRPDMTWQAARAAVAETIGADSHDGEH